MNENIRRLELEYTHADDIVLASIGQDDFADNVAYRDSVAAELAAARDAEYR